MIVKNAKLYLLPFLIIIQSCATFKPQYSSNAKQEIFPKDKKITHTFYLIGDAGNGIFKDSNSLANYINTASKNSIVLFLGDNIYPEGMPKRNDKNRNEAEKKMQNQLDITSSFKGKTIFIPGNHDWYSNGVEGLKENKNL